MQTETTSGRFLLMAASFVVLVAGMKAASPMLVPFLLSVFIAIISAPAMFWLRQKGFSQFLALILVISAITVVGAVLVAVAGASIDAFQQALPEYQARLKTQTSGLFAWLGEHGLPVDKQWIGMLDPGAIMNLASGLFNGLGSMLANGFLIFLTVIFILLEAASFPGKLQRCLKDPQASMERLRRVAESINHYLAIKTWASLATGLIVAAGLAIIGVDFPVLWGLLAFLLNYVPNIGAFIAALPALLLALVQLGSGAVIWTLLIYLAVNNIIGNLIEPRFMGRKLGLSTLVVFLSLVFWGWILGPVGMLLSVPLTMTLKIALEASDETRWIAILLGNEESDDCTAARDAAKGSGDEAAE